MLSSHALAKLLLIATVMNLSGCLSLGTRTTHVNDNPETTRRLANLENRIGALELTFRGAVTPQPPADMPLSLSE